MALSALKSPGTIPLTIPPTCSPNTKTALKLPANITSPGEKCIVSHSRPGTGGVERREGRSKRQEAEGRGGRWVRWRRSGRRVKGDVGASFTRILGV